MCYDDSTDNSGRVFVTEQIGRIVWKLAIWNPLMADPRVVRTKTQLRDALFMLLQTQRWEKVRVQDILDETGISRSAFYAHFDSKYDLFTSAIPDQLDVFLGDPVEGVDLTPLFEHIAEVGHIMKPLLTQPVGGEIFDEFHRALARRWQSFLAETPHAGDDMLADLLAGAVLAVAKQFLMQRQREEPTAVSKRLNNHLQQLIDAKPTAA